MKNLLNLHYIRTVQKTSMATRITVNPRFESLRRYFTGIPSAFDNEGEVIFKGRNTIRRLTAPDGTQVAVKRFASLSWPRRLIYTTQCHSKGRRAYEYGLRFLSLGFDTPEPMAYIETYRGGLIDEVYFISPCTDHIPLSRALTDHDYFDPGLADMVAGYMAALHSAGAMHGDPNLGNILYRRDDDGEVSLTMIDTNRSRFGRSFSTRQCLKNLMRVTHRRALMRHIVRRYAELRGLDPTKTVRRVTKMLQRFERNRRIRHKIKRIIKSFFGS